MTHLPIANLSNHEFLTKGWPVRLVVGATCFLSMIGGLLIILSYACFKNMRSKARWILVHLSVMDFGVGAANLIGDLVYFDRFYDIGYNTTYDEDVVDIRYPSRAVQNLCVAQAFFAVYFTLGSILWTVSLAVYLYFVLVHYKTQKAKYFLWFSYVLCWGFPLFLSLWMAVTHKLGWAPYDSSGWCTIIVINPATLERDYFVVVVGYDLWIYIALFLVPIMYFAVRSFLREEHQKTKEFITVRNFWKAVHNLDYKFLFIPIAFTFLRVWSCIVNIIYVYADLGHNLPSGLSVALIYLSGIGDSGQGIANAVIFVVFTRQVRKNVVSWSKQHCCCLPSKSDPLLAEAVSDRDGEDAADGGTAGCSAADSLEKILQKKQVSSSTDVETPAQFSNTFEVIQ